MGALYDYFAAASDEQASGVIDRVGGPGSQSILVTPADEPKRGLFRRKAPEPQFSTDPGLEIFDTVSVKGIDPVVNLGTLEELLTGRPYDEVALDPRSGEAVAVRGQGETLVVTVTDTLVSALVDATDERLGDVAVAWLQTEELRGQGDPADAAAFLREFAGLATRAKEKDQRLYCWVCV